MSLQDKLILTTVDLDELTSTITSAILEALNEFPQQNTAVVSNEELQYLKPKAAAKIIGYGKDFIYKLVKDGKLSGYYPGSDLVISKGELLEYMERKKIEGIKPLKKVS